MNISVIVPVYNAEKYLPACVQSILGQTFQDFELILVDDGSPDSCGEMCECWARKDDRIKVIHKENGGLSDARNAGLDIAQGDYIGFVDSDDYIRRDMFEVLVTNLEKTSADISMCGYTDIYEDGRSRGRKCTDDNTVYIWDRKEAIHEILLGKKLSVHAYTKLYRRALFEYVRYPKGKISEDAYVIMDIMAQVNRAVFTPRTEYYYVHRGDSINTAKYREIDKTRIEAHRKNYEYIKQTYPEYEKLAFDRYLGAMCFVANKMIVSGANPKETKKILKELRKNRRSIMTSEYFSTRRKAIVFVMIANKSLYKYIIKTARL